MGKPKDPNYFRKWREANKGYNAQWRRRNSDKIKKYEKRGPEYFHAYYENNKGRYKARDARRRARELNAGSGFSNKDVRNAIAAQRNKCWWCTGLLTDYHVDHRIPLARGGKNDPSNIVIACPTCNLAKGKKMPWEMASPRLL